MKKFVPILLFMSVLFTLFAGVGQAAAAVVPKLYFNGQLLQSKVNPQIVQDKYTIVPIRIVTESIGYKVTWSKATQTVTIHSESDEIILKINDNIALVNNNKVQMDMPAILQSGTTLIPLRFVGEQLGLTVRWDNATKSVYLTKEEEPEVPVEPTPPPATTTGTITSVMYDGVNGIILNYDGTVIPNKAFKLDNPKRIVIDMPNVGYSDALLAQFNETQTQIPVVDNPYLQNVRFSVFSNSPLTARIVLDLVADADVEIIEGSGELRFHMTEASTTPPEPTVPPTTPVPTDKVYNVVIDAGHGGTDPGAKSIIAGKWEKEFNLSMALKVKALLDKEKNIKPLLSRPDDKYITLAGRVAFAEKNKADVFISIHANSSTSSTVTGTETYYTRESSKALANTVHKYFAKSTGLKDRTVKKDSFHVIRETTMPAILLEAGFLSNKSDSNILFNNAAQERMAAAIVAGIKEYLKLS
ncbi:MAG: N-acetylmuramoyl-L-alanine amidase [Candidatus Pristimantibacillus sp.]